MCRLSHPAFAGATLLAVVAAVCWWRGPSDDDVPVDPALTARTVELDAGYAAAERRRIEKAELVRALLDGKLTLSHAADRLLALHREVPAIDRMVQETYAGDTDHEKTARYLAAYVRTMDLTDAQRAQLAGRLEQEFAVAFGRPLTAVG